MSASMTMSIPHKQVALGLLDQQGYDVADFDVEDDDSPELHQLLGLDDALVSVIRKSTGTHRLYTAGPYSSWLAELQADVEQGHFGRPDAQH